MCRIGSLGAHRQRSVSCVWAVELSNGEVGRGDAGLGKVRQSWIVQFRQRVSGIGSSGMQWMGSDGPCMVR